MVPIYSKNYKYPEVDEEHWMEDCMNSASPDCKRKYDDISLDMSGWKYMSNVKLNVLYSNTGLFKGIFILDGQNHQFYYPIIILSRRTVGGAGHCSTFRVVHLDCWIFRFGPETIWSTTRPTFARSPSKLNSPVPGAFQREIQDSSSQPDLWMYQLKHLWTRKQLECWSNSSSN